MTNVPASSKGGGAKSNGAPVSAITPEEAARVRGAVGKKEVAPSSRVQSIFGNWKEVSDQLGSPYEVERIPLSKLRQMRRDAMLGFGLSFIKTPHIRAKWFINAKDSKGPNAQIAAHLDHDLRRIYPSFVLQNTNMLDFGFQAIAKRFEFRQPVGTYVEINPTSGEQVEKPIWSSGSIDPIAWKQFISLRPEGVEPQWNNDGEFDGILYSPSDANTALGITTSGGSGGSNQDSTYKIDLDHSLWVTNEKEAAFGSIFGYPRLGYAYRFWWSYWFRWAIADRAFERKADPSVIVRYPEGYFQDPLTGIETSYQEYALEMGSRMRSGGVIALPSEPYEDANGRGTLRQWELEFTKDAINFDPFDNSFSYLDIMKLRALFIPEQSLIEGGGGTSSRNVAAEMSDSFTESQAVLSAQIQENINRYMIPQWIAVNYPEFAAAGGAAEIIIQGFADEDTEFMRQLVQLLGQQEAGAKEIIKLVDLQKVLEDRGTPIVPWAEQNRRDQELASQQSAAGVGEVAPVPGQQVGTVPSGNGFSYIQPKEVIYLSDSDSDFISSLPDTAHFSSKQARIAARDLKSRLTDFYESQYEFYISDLDNGLDNSGIVSAVEDIRLILSGASSEVDDWAKQESVDVVSRTTETVRSEVSNYLVDYEADAARKHFADFADWHSASDAVKVIRNLHNEEAFLSAKSEGANILVAIEEGSDLDGTMFIIEEARKVIFAPNRMVAWKALPSNFEIERDQDVSGGAVWDEETMTLSLSDGIDPEVEKKIIKSILDEIQ